MIRLFLNACVLVSLLMFPWYFTLAFMLLLILNARAYEVLFWGYLGDALYSASLPGLLHVPVIFTAVAGLMLLLLELIKPSLVFYER